MSAIQRFWVRAQLRQFPHSASEARIVLALLVLTLVLRAPGITRPLLGNFATKNVVYAMVARNWAHNASSMWYPTLDCLQGNAPALHMLELPVAAYIAGGCWWLLGGSLDAWGRALSIAFSAGAVLLLYRLVRYSHRANVAAAAAAAYALAPVSVIYGQAFMLEASLVCFALAALEAVHRWCERPRHPTLVLFIATFALALLTKLYLIVLLLPIAWWAGHAWMAGRLRGSHLACGLAALFVSVAPAALWYAHAASTADSAHPLHERVFYSVSHSVAAHWPPPSLLFEPRFYGRLTVDLFTVVLTPVGLSLALLGALRRDARAWLPWLAACAVLIAILPRKFHEMNYYYLPVLPPLCILVGLGWETLRARFADRRLALAIALLAVVLSVRYFARPAFVTPIEDSGVLAAAEVVRQRTEPNERIATMHGTTFDLLYYCDRKGWFLAPDDPRLRQKLAACRRAGARLLAVAETSPQHTWRLAHLRCIERGPGFAVYELPERRSEPDLAAELPARR